MKIMDRNKNKNKNKKKSSNEFTYYFKDQLAYTEDHVRILNIFFFNVIGSATIDNLRKHFSKFGAIISIRFLCKTRMSRKFRKYGFVNFKSAYVAAHVLNTNDHKIGSHRFFVKPCDSWHQPKIESAVATASTSTTPDNAITPKGSSINSCQSILNLNLDCLFNIFQHLELCEQIHFSVTHEKFAEAFRMYSRIYFKTLDVEVFKNLTLSEIREFLQINGDIVTKIKGRLPCKYPMRCLDFITTYSTNLVSFHVKAYKMTANSIRKLAHNVSTLKDIEMCDCLLTDRAVRQLCNFYELERLTLCHNKRLTGKYMDELPKTIKVLNLLGCTNLQSSCMMDFLDNLDTLTDLDIRGCEANIWYMFGEIIKRLENLVTLRFSCPIFVPYEEIADLPKLKCLEIDSHWQDMVIRPELFAALSQKKSDTLKTLIVIAKNSITFEHLLDIVKLQSLRQLDVGDNDDIDDHCLEEILKLENLEDFVVSNCQNVTNHGILHFLNGSINLKVIDVQHCFNINDAFITGASAIMKSRNKSLTIYAAFSGITKNLQVNAEFVKFIKLSFEKTFVLRSELMKKRQFDFINDIWIGDDGNYEDIWEFLKSEQQYDNYEDIFDYNIDEIIGLENEFVLNRRFEQFARR